MKKTYKFFVTALAILMAASCAPEVLDKAQVESEFTALSGVPSASVVSVENLDNKAKTGVVNVKFDNYTAEMDSLEFSVLVSVYQDFRDSKSFAVDLDDLSQDGSASVNITITPGKKNYVMAAVSTTSGSAYSEISEFEIEEYVEPWVYIGDSTFSEDLLTAFFNVPVGTQWVVETYTNINYPGSYFFKNAFTSEYPFNEPGDYVEEDMLFEVRVKENGDVWIPYQNLGMDWGYGEFALASDVSEVFSDADPSTGYGRIENSIIKFEPKTILISMAEYKDGAFYYSNGDGKFFIALPDAVLLDLETSLSYGGMIVGSDNTTVSYVMNVEAAADVAAVKYAASATAAAEALVEDIVAGNAAGEVAVSAGFGSIILSGLEPGIYTVVAVPVDSDGNLHPDNTASKTVKFIGLGASEQEVLPVAGIYSMTDYFGDETSFELTADPDDATGTKFFVTNFGISNDVTLYSTFDPESMTLSVSGVMQGLENYGNLMGQPVFYFNEEKTQLYGYFAYASEESDGTDDAVFAVDPATGFLTSALTGWGVGVYNAATEEMLGSYTYVEAGATIEYTPFAPSAPARVSPVGQYTAKRVGMKGKTRVYSMISGISLK